jgi:hypothetical protein
MDHPIYPVIKILNLGTGIGFQASAPEVTPRGGLFTLLVNLGTGLFRKVSGVVLVCALQWSRIIISYGGVTGAS